ncbi:MAG: ATP-binding protein [Rhodanobacteraceae bacterium]|nr:ATP-binding protein [Rhodanobacteraceae bacterium]
MAIAEPPPKSEGELGRTIKGETLFGVGPDLAAWISLLIEHQGAVPDSPKALQGLVSAHWARGMRMLTDEVRAADKDASQFWRRLAESALPASGGMSVAEPRVFGGDVVAAPVVLQIGEVGTDVMSNEPVVWSLNAPGGSPHSAFMGGVGSGKTRTAAFVLRSLAEQSPTTPLIAFDFKGDMSDKNNALDKAFGATVLSPLIAPIPLDVFALADSGRHTITTTALRLRDSLSNLKEARFGDLQRRRLNDALETALRNCKPCTLPHVRDALKKIYASEGVKEDGAVSSLVELCRLPLFEPKYSPAEFFSKSWIISLPANVPELVRVAVVSLLTDALERHINTLTDAATDTNGNRALRSMCVIDEAHKILGARLPGLANLIRLGRSKGAAVMLISQRPDDFAGEDDDFLAEMGLIGCFSTNANPAQVRRIFGPGSALTALKKGEALIKVRGDARAAQVVCWQ